MGIYKKGNNYFIDYYYRGRRKREMVGPSKKMAETALQKRKIEIAENKFLDIRKEEKILFEDFAKLYYETHSVPNKRSFIRDEGLIKNLTGFFGGKFLHEITPLFIEKYKIERKASVKETTINDLPPKKWTI